MLCLARTSDGSGLRGGMVDGISGWHMPGIGKVDVRQSGGLDM